MNVTKDKQDRQSKQTKLRYAIGIPLASAALLFGLLPTLCYGIVNAGSIALLLYGSIALVLILTWHKIPWRALRWSVAGLLALLFLTGAIISTLMMKYALFHQPAPGTNGTVVVLGCHIQGDQPSTMLQDRLDRAVRYLKAHPETKVIVSGGQGPDEITSEANVMLRYLQEQGISADRIYKEEASKNTEENIALSRDLIEAEGLPNHMILISNSFHLYRATLFAQSEGISCNSIASSTPWPVFPAYWVREILGVLHKTFL